MILTRRIFYIIIFSFLLFSCKNKKIKPALISPSGYDFLNPVTIKLPDALAEISGIVFYSKDSSAFAIEDEDGLFYKINLNKKDDIKKWRFDKKHDFEDLALHDSIFYVLISNGDIETLKFGTGDSVTSTLSEFPDAAKKRNEFESLYYDDSLKQLVLFCKNCEDDTKNVATAWGFSIETGAYTPNVYMVNLEPVLKKLGVDKLKLKPSATAVNPVNNQLYILSSIDHLIMVTDRQGNFIDIYQLDPAIYKQAEGISFTPSGDMLISNESHQTGYANILLIRNKKKGI